MTTAKWLAIVEPLVHLPKGQGGGVGDDVIGHGVGGVVRGVGVGVW